MKREKRFDNTSAKTKERSKSLILLELGEDLFAVSSATKPNWGYLLTQKNGCTCEGYSRNADCAHLKRVEAFLDERETSTA